MLLHAVKSESWRQVLSSSQKTSVVAVTGQAKGLGEQPEGILPLGDVSSQQDGNRESLVTDGLDPFSSRILCLGVEATRGCMRRLKYSEGEFKAHRHRIRPLWRLG